MPISTKTAADLLHQAAEFYRKIAVTTPGRAAELEENAKALTAAAEDLKSETPPASSPRQDGPWMRRASWLRKDRPPWTTDWQEHSASNATHERSRTAIVQAINETFKDTPNDAQRQLSLLDVSTISYNQPVFLPEVVVAYCARDGDPAWDALFSISTSERSDTESRQAKARSYDFQSGEVHRLNYVSPLNTVGNELAYLRYFMYIVRAELGAFRILEGTTWASTHQILEEANHTDGTPLKSHLHPLRVVRVAGNGCIVYAVCLLYGSVVFDAELALQPDGMINMLADTPLTSELKALAE